MHDLTGFQRDLLYVVAGFDDPHGLALKEELEDYYESEIHHGRLYPNLDTLVEKGLIEKGQADRRTNYYTLTRRGRRELDARAEWKSQYVELEADGGTVGDDSGDGGGNGADDSTVDDSSADDAA